MKVFNYIAVLSFLNACKEPIRVNQSLMKSSQSVQQQFNKDTLFSLNNISIIFPKGWRLANDDTLSTVCDATARYRFHNNSKKLIYLQYGLGTIGNPAEPKVQSSRFRKGYIQNGADTSGITFTDNQKLAAIREISGYIFNNEVVSGFQALFYKPRKYGAGYTGLYIDSIGTIADNIADFTFYAQNLDSAETNELIRVILSFKIKPLK